MKYSQKEYEDFDMFAGDMDEECEIVSQKIITPRKSHICNECHNEIPMQTKCLSISGRGEEGYITIYFCIECMDKMIDEIKEEEATNEH